MNQGNRQGAILWANGSSTHCTQRSSNGLLVWAASLAPTAYQVFEYHVPKGAIEQIPPARTRVPRKTLRTGHLKGPICGCFHKLGVYFLGVLNTRALVVWLSIRAARTSGTWAGGVVHGLRESRSPEALAECAELGNEDQCVHVPISTYCINKIILFYI